VLNYVYRRVIFIHFLQAVKANGMIYVSGCLGMDPETKKIVPGGVGAEAR
jgi:enamine deaminase RidA (YjgF/YER057c/UK114 family)